MSTADRTCDYVVKTKIYSVIKKYKKVHRIESMNQILTYTRFESTPAGSASVSR